MDNLYGVATIIKFLLENQARGVEILSFSALSLASFVEAAVFVAGHIMRHMERPEMSQLGLCRYVRGMGFTGAGRDVVRDR